MLVLSAVTDLVSCSNVPFVFPLFFAVFFDINSTHRTTLSRTIVIACNLLIHIINTLNVPNMCQKLHLFRCILFLPVVVSPMFSLFLHMEIMSSSANSALFNTLVQHLLNDEKFKAALRDQLIPSVSHGASTTLTNVSHTAPDSASVSTNNADTLPDTIATTACTHSNVHDSPATIVPVTPHVTMQSSESVSAHDHSVSYEDRGRHLQSGSGHSLSSAPSFDAKRSDDSVNVFPIVPDYSIFSDKPSDSNGRFFDLVGDSSDAEGECEDGLTDDVSMAGNDFGIRGNTEHVNVDFCAHGDVDIDGGVDSDEGLGLEVYSYDMGKERKDSKRMDSKPFMGVTDEGLNAYSFGDVIDIDSSGSDLLDVWTAPDTSGKKPKLHHPVQSPDSTDEHEILESGFCTSQDPEKKTAYSYLTPNRNCESPTSLDFFSFLSTVAKGESNQQFDPSSFVHGFRSKIGSHKEHCIDDEFNFDTVTKGEQASKCFCLM